MTPSIARAKEKIVELFSDQCKHGAQNNELADNQYACGQFMGDEAKDIDHSGLHGTSAAIRVLATDPDSKTVVEGMVRWVSNQIDFHPDYENTIKVSELLYALSFVKVGVPNLDTVKKKLIAKLHDSGSPDGQAWGFNTADSNNKEIIPTSYALMALASAKESVKEPKRFLIEKIKSTHKANSGTYVDYSSVVLSMYALLFSKDVELTSEELADITKEFRRVWSRTSGIIKNENVEQNIEYRTDRTQYVRIPWQLYLIAIASEIDPSWTFQFVSCRTRLTNIIESVADGKFCYPYSGNLISTRTNAIVFDVLCKIEQNTRFRAKKSFATYLDAWRSSPVVKWSIRIVATVFAIFVLIAFFISKDATLSDIAPEIVGAILVWLMSWSKQN